MLSSSAPRAVSPSTCWTIVLLLLAGASSWAGASVPSGPPTFSDPLNITNPYHPFQPGAIKVFRGTSDDVKTTVVDSYSATTRAFNVDGNDVDCRVLEEIEFERGRLVEISRNFFAQADDGTVYYFGEVVDIYEDGVVVDHEGSWLVGGVTLPSDPPGTANADAPAVYMPANPEVGDVYKPEDTFPIVDESDEVMRVGLALDTPAGRFSNVIRVRETTLLGPDTETKWYAAGVGVVTAKAKDEILKLVASTLRP